MQAITCTKWLTDLHRQDRLSDREERMALAQITQQPSFPGFTRTTHFPICKQRT